MAPGLASHASRVGEGVGAVPAGGPGAASASGPRRSPWSRARGWLTVWLAVLVGHALLIEWVSDSLIGWDAADRAPKRLEVAFVKTLQQAAPRGEASRPPERAAAAKRPAHAAGLTAVTVSPAARAASVPAARRPHAAVPRAPQVAVQAPPPVAVLDAPAVRLDAPASLPSSPDDDPLRGLAQAAPQSPPTWLRDDRLAGRAPVAAQGPASPASGPAIPIEDWPPSTRLRYTLTGNYRGAIGGTAEVRWVRVGNHYQVQMDVTVGLPFAPLMTRRVTSDGQITDDGLRPEQFDEVTKRAFQPPWHVGARFEGSMAWMSNGNAVFAPPGTQDSASQFVQLTWLFTLHPELLQPGRRIMFPLALQNRVTPWVYEVGQAENLYTIFGDVPVVHVSTHPQVPIGRVLSVECWFAPTLQYLPARILVRESESTYIDLVLDRLPQQALPTPAAAAASTSQPAPVHPGAASAPTP